VGRLHPTYRHPLGPTYRAPGGAWDLPSLDALITRAHDDPRVGALAGGLRENGVRRGDVVAWQLPNWDEASLLYRACWRLGAIAGPIHHQAGTAEVDRMFRVLSPRLTLHTDDVRGSDARFRRLLDATPVTHSSARPSDLAVALFTAGSTGEPKAALHTQRGLAHKALTMARAHGLTSADAVLMPAPLAHISGLLNAVLIPGVVPMRSILMDKWDPERALDLITTERITFMIGPPTFFVVLMGAPDFTTERVESLRLVSSGGAGVTPAFVDEATERLGARVKRTYGSTEAPTITTSLAADPPDRARATDGRATGAARLRISDPATGAARAIGDVGELWLRGPELFVGYRDAAQTRAAISRGWFRTGDLAMVDDDGWLTIVGRIKDIIIRGGENISAAEVERVLEAHPDVRQAVAVGAPDDRLGERVCAFVVTSAPFDLDACRAWFEQQGATRFTTPELVVRVDELPALPSGKPDRASLRARAAASPSG
jgi:acyl-CoA synthetase (AMP-forming)/AMP-acid ligase II